MTATKQPLHIVLACDDIFAMPLAAAGASVLRHVSSPERVVFNIIDCGISARNIDRIRRSLSRKGATVRVMKFTTPVPTSWLQAGIIPSVATFARLFVQDYVTEDVRAVYLDSDTIVCTDIAPLVEQLADGMLVGGVSDDPAGGVTAKGLERLAKWFPADAEDSPYINAGVMVFDLWAWRSAGLSQRFKELMADTDAMQFADQDAINIVCAGRIQTFEPRWNVQTHHLPSLDGAILDDPNASPRVIHFTHRPKPWHGQGDVGMSRPFYEAIDETEWKGWRPTGLRLLVPKLRRGWRLARQRPTQMLKRLVGKG